jgi:purine-nucleoside phosphorylase
MTLTTTEEFTAGVAEAAAFINSKLPATHRPSVAIILGSGLSDFYTRLEQPVEFAFADIPNMPVTSVSGHAGTTPFFKK